MNLLQKYWVTFWLIVAIFAISKVILVTRDEKAVKEMLDV